MSCGELHQLLRGQKRYSFPFAEKELPLDGIYLLFEQGEEGHGGERIVRVGTHTGQGQLRSRLKQHFLQENKDRSIFRKNIGRCILFRDPFREVWECDRTPKTRRDLTSEELRKQREVEKQVSQYIQKNFTFVVIPIESKEQRLLLESKIISTISLCKECSPSRTWFGLRSPKEKIRTSGLWLVNELGKIPLSEEDMEKLRKLL